MSDVGVAPAPSSSPPTPAAPPQSPSSGQVPINTDQTSPPAPIGSQAPPSAEARRESIQKAFNKVRDPEWQKSRPGPAQAVKGHNNPPEETPDEKPKAPPPLNLRKRPDQQDLKTLENPPAQSARPRGEGGRFASRQQAQMPQVQTPGVTTGANPPVAPLPQHAPYREAPRRWDDRAKADWAAVPESVRGAVYRTGRNFDKMYKNYQALDAAIAPLRPYYELARSQGVHLHRAIENYISIEDKLRADPIGGLDLIVNNLNLRTPEGRRLGLIDVAYHVLNQTPEQRQITQQNNTQTALAQQLAALQKYQQELAQWAQQVHHQQQFRHTRGLVDQFAETHPRLDELGPIIERELKLGFDLDTAYRRAELLQPATHAAQTRTQPPHAAQTRTPDRSIRGGPERGATTANGSARTNGREVSRRDALSNAMRKVRGSL